MGRSLPGPGQPEIGYRHQGAGGNHHYDKHDSAEAVLVEHLDKPGQGFDRGRVEDEVHEVSRGCNGFYAAVTTARRIALPFVPATKTSCSAAAGRSSGGISSLTTITTWCPRPAAIGRRDAAQAPTQN
jgi:hypothetical protein